MRVYNLQDTVGENKEKFANNALKFTLFPPDSKPEI